MNNWDRMFEQAEENRKKEAQEKRQKEEEEKVIRELKKAYNFLGDYRMAQRQLLRYQKICNKLEIADKILRALLQDLEKGSKYPETSTCFDVSRLYLEELDTDLLKKIIKKELEKALTKFEFKVKISFIREESTIISTSVHGTLYQYEANAGKPQYIKKITVAVKTSPVTAAEHWKSPKIPFVWVENFSDKIRECISAEIVLIVVNALLGSEKSEFVTIKKNESEHSVKFLVFSNIDEETKALVKEILLSEDIEDRLFPGLRLPEMTLGLRWGYQRINYGYRDVEIIEEPTKMLVRLQRCI